MHRNTLDDAHIPFIVISQIICADVAYAADHGFGSSGAGHGNRDICTPADNATGQTLGQTQTVPMQAQCIQAQCTHARRSRTFVSPIQVDGLGPFGVPRCVPRSHMPR